MVTLALNVPVGMAFECDLRQPLPLAPHTGAYSTPKNAGRMTLPGCRICYGGGSDRANFVWRHGNGINCARFRDSGGGTVRESATLAKLVIATAAALSSAETDDCGGGVDRFSSFKGKKGRHLLDGGGGGDCVDSRDSGGSGRMRAMIPLSPPRITHRQQRRNLAAAELRGGENGSGGGIGSGGGDGI